MTSPELQSRKVCTPSTEPAFLSADVTAPVHSTASSMLWAQLGRFVPVSLKLWIRRRTTGSPGSSAFLNCNFVSRINGWKTALRNGSSLSPHFLDDADRLSG